MPPIPSKPDRSATDSFRKTQKVRPGIYLPSNGVPLLRHNVPDERRASLGRQDCGEFAGASTQLGRLSSGSELQIPDTRNRMQPPVWLCRIPATRLVVIESSSGSIQGEFEF